MRKARPPCEFISLQPCWIRRKRSPALSHTAIQHSSHCSVTLWRWLLPSQQITQSSLRHINRIHMVLRSTYQFFVDWLLWSFLFIWNFEKLFIVFHYLYFIELLISIINMLISSFETHFTYLLISCSDVSGYSTITIHFSKLPFQRKWF